MKYAVDYFMDILDEKGRKTDMIMPGVAVKIQLNDGYVKTGTISSIRRNGIYLVRPQIQGTTFYNFGNIKDISRTYPGREVER